jgi:hypothetical protein
MENELEPALMIKTSLILFTLTALGGVVMGFVRLGRGLNPPSWLAMVHGLLAASGLTLLLYAFFTAGLPGLAGWALLLFVVAAAGGLVLNIGYHAKAALLPKGIVVVHALVAVVAYALLLMTVLGTPKA